MVNTEIKETGARKGLTVTPRCGGGNIPLGSNSVGITGTIVGVAVNAAT
jgi:hypothetical protein